MLTNKADLDCDSQSIADGGTLLYCPHFFDAAQADTLLASLRETVAWKQEHSRGRPFPRLTAWYADTGLTYSYSGVTHHALEWLPDLQMIRERVQQAASATFNSLLLNLYRDGKDSIGYHADNEPELGTNPIIASVTFGATRRFLLRHKSTNEKLSFDLSHGSLLVMGGTCQHFWLHSVPKTEAEIGERINLTFRLIRE